MLRLRKREIVVSDWPRPDYLSPIMHALLKMRGIKSEKKPMHFYIPPRSRSAIPSCFPICKRRWM